MDSVDAVKKWLRGTAGEDCLPGDAAELAAILTDTRADEALYVSKRFGRNKAAVL